jgi:excisionase family DNA binding protein
MDALTNLVNALRQFLQEIADNSKSQNELQKPTPVQTPKDPYFTVQELSDYLPGNPPVATIYAWSSKGQIPKTPLGRRIVFKKSQIDSWIAAKYSPTIAEIASIPIPTKKRK